MSPPVAWPASKNQGTFLELSEFWLGKSIRVVLVVCFVCTCVYIYIHIYIRTYIYFTYTRTCTNVSEAGLPAIAAMAHMGFPSMTSNQMAEIWTAVLDLSSPCP